MNIAIMEIEDETTLYLCFTLEDIEKMHRVIEGGGMLLPAMDMKALGDDLGCTNPITMLQTMLVRDDAHAQAACDDIASMLGLRSDRRGPIPGMGYHTGDIPKKEPKTDGS